MTNSMQKGKRGEREWANYLKSKGFTEVRRGQQYNGLDGEDVVGLPHIHNEVKRVEKLVLWPSIEQSQNDANADQTPIVAHRPNRKPWIVIMYADDFIELYKKAYPTEGRQTVLEELE